nr:hypothetical protein BaRGS_027752 [Batillaria attramentaria]
MCRGLCGNTVPDENRRWSNVTRTFIFSRQDVAFSFNRSWLEYRDGFGDLSGDFFLGLEKLHLLTKSKIYQLRFRVKLPNATLYFVYYDDFVLSDETSDYSFTFSLAKEISLGDCLTSLLGAGFSTYDRDNDGDSSVNCAQRHGGGWWFSGAACTTCNPLGPILQPFDGRRKGVDGEAFWTGVPETLARCASGQVLTMNA